MCAEDILKSVGWAGRLNSKHTLQWKDLHGDELNLSQLFGTELLCPKDSAGFQGDESAAFQSRICCFGNNNGELLEPMEHLPVGDSPACMENLVLWPKCWHLLQNKVAFQHFLNKKKKKEVCTEVLQLAWDIRYIHTSSLLQIDIHLFKI